jgi:hypothetical protein
MEDCHCIIGNLLFIWLGSQLWRTLITLTVLREEIRPNSAIKILRIISMGILIVMPTFTIIPIGYITYDGSSLQPGNSFPTECLYHPSIVWGDVYSGAKIHPSYNWIYVSLAISILVFGFSTRVHGLLTDSSIFQTVLRIPKGRIWNGNRSKKHWKGSWTSSKSSLQLIGPWCY